MRLSDWEERFSHYIESVFDKDFVWGEHDCALSFINAARAITGEDRAPEFRGKYSTELGSIRALKRIGAGDLESTLDEKFPVIPASMAQRGDGIWDGAAVGICMGSYALFVGQSDERQGMFRVPRSDWVKAWRVE